jgi:hypothetical protein
MTLALLAAVVALLVHTASLLSPNEGFRGAGRVSLGFALLALAYPVSAAPGGLLVAVVAFITVLAGIVTVVTGARKYLRRNEA